MSTFCIFQRSQHALGSSFQLYWFAVPLLIATLSVNPFAHAQNALPVSVAQVTVAEVNRGQRVIGSVRPLKSSTIGSAADGRILEFYVNRGDAVVAGQPLAQLRTETLEIELAAAQAESELYRQQLNELKNGSREEDIAEARAKLGGAKAALVNAASQLARAESLSRSRAASDAELDQAKATAELARNNLAASEALLARLVAGPRVEQIAQAQASFDLQEQRVQLIRDRIKKHTIVAPFDGFVAEEFTEVGAWVTQGDPIARVIELSQVEIEVPATAESALRLREGHPIRVEFPEVPERVLVGQVDHVVPTADERTRTFPVLVRLENEFVDGAPLLMAGMLARVDLPAGRRTRLPLVPKDALVLNGASRSVFVVEIEDRSESMGVAHERPVKLGVASEGSIQVSGDIDDGDIVVVVGNERLFDGAKVRIVDVATQSQQVQE